MYKHYRNLILHNGEWASLNKSKKIITTGFKNRCEINIEPIYVKNIRIIKNIKKLPVERNAILTTRIATRANYYWFIVELFNIFQQLINSSSNSVILNIPNNDKDFLLPMIGTTWAECVKKLLGAEVKNINDYHEKTLFHNVLAGWEYIQTTIDKKAEILNQFKRKILKNLEIDSTIDSTLATIIYRPYINKNSTRIFTNIDSIISALIKKYRIQIVSLENLSYREQVKCFTTSKIIVGGHGAGLAHSVFMGKGQTLVEVQPCGCNHDVYGRITKATGAKYALYEVSKKDAQFNRKYLDRVIPDLDDKTLISFKGTHFKSDIKLPANLQWDDIKLFYRQQNLHVDPIRFKEMIY